jgi:glycosyltransferase involved in cell wall biosynthesis
MRIAFVVDTIEPFYFGGYEKRAFELARCLAKRHEVTVFTSARRCQTVDDVRFIPVRPEVATFKDDGYRSTGQALLFAAAVAARAVRGVPNFDVVDCNATPYLHIPSAWALARRSRARLVLSVHEALSAALEDYFRARGSPAGRHRLRVLQSGYRFLHYLPDAIVATSEVTATELRREGIATVGTTHGGISTLGTPRDSYRGRLICLARLVPAKRVQVAIEAFALARTSGHAQQLTIVGDGPELPSLRRLAADRGVADCVRFCPGITEDEKVRILRDESDACISASLREGLSIATLEALGAGNPAVISSRPELSINGALEYLVDDVNGFVTDGDARSIASAVERLARDGPNFRRLSSAAIATVRRYTWETAAAELEGVYETALSTPRRATRNQRRGVA